MGRTGSVGGVGRAVDTGVCARVGRCAGAVLEVLGEPADSVREIGLDGVPHIVRRNVRGFAYSFSVNRL